MIRALIFDFDGLILDTEMPALRSWEDLFAEHGHPFPAERWMRIIGTADRFDAVAHLEQLLGTTLDRDGLLRWRSARKMALTDAELVRPGVVALLDMARARGLRVGVASSSPTTWVGDHLTRLGLFDRFDAICCAEDDPERAKPLPALYLEALECLGVRADEAIAFEDSPNGVTAARRAGLVCVAVPNGVTSRLDLDHADLVVSSLEDPAVVALLDGASP
ncbi:MAG: HAD family hydrolase [Acidimicrobiales bacterium]